MSNRETLERNNQTAKDLLSFVAKGVYHTKIIFVGAYFVDTPETGGGSWVLVDTGLPMSDGKIRRAAKSKYGDKKPSAIVLTHGHFDHAGAALALAEQWNVPIYAHRLEMPYLTGKSDYPPQDPTVGGAIAFMSRFFPHSGYDFGNRVHAIPENGKIAELPNWKIFHMPGHTAGHISLWRESDRTLLAGDALTTMNLDSWVSQITEKQEFCPPPAPFTTDWQAARRSVEFLADLEPKVVGAGHGKPITDRDTARQLKEFARNFEPPRKGRYVETPAIIDEYGVVALPPPATDYLKIAAGAVAAGVFLMKLAGRKKNQKESLKND
ncbi:MAG TPA: MBL fold metallo-hydrolase [Pyrinomonadaceae bacterium]|nr:MBL fold metallo-hydrolase [Pyrinomonadaceae bacterium]